MPLPRKVALAAEIVVAYARARWLVRWRELPAALAALRPQGAAADDPDILQAIDLGRNVGRLLAALPADSRCLMRSLVLTRLLDRRGIPSSVVIGVQPGEKFGAHAWVEVSGRPVLDAGGGSFARLVEL